MDLADIQVPKCSKKLANNLKTSLQDELIASDALASMFVSALRKYKESCADIAEIIEVINDTPNLNIVLRELKASDIEAAKISLDDTKIEWLHWLIVDGPKLHMLNSVDYVELMLSLDRFERVKQKPLHIFEIKSVQIRRLARKRGRNKAKNANIRYGFYVDQLSEFYTIIKKGFQNYSCKENHFTGRKLRLLPDLQSAVNSLKYDDAWCGSICGTKVSCIALCSYINNLKRVHIECNTLTDSTIIEDSDLVIPHFILFYGNRGLKSDIIEQPYDLLQNSSSNQGILSCTTAQACKETIQKNLTTNAIAALGHLVVPLCNQILS